MRRTAFLAALAFVALATPACGRRPGLVETPKVLKAADRKLPVVASQAKDFPASVARLEVKATNTAYLVVRWRAAKLGFNQVSKVGFPVLVRGEEEFKSNLYLGADDRLYISDLGTAAKPRFWRVGSWGTPRFIAGRPEEGDTVNMRFDPGIVLDLAVDDGKESGGKLGIDIAMSIKSTPPASAEPELWTKPLAEAP
jgi:hypothetical protein